MKQEDHSDRRRPWLPKTEQSRLILQEAATASGITLDPYQPPTPDQAEALREAVFDLLFRTGLDGERPNPRGYLMEGLIDGLQRYTEDD
ncbi:hypothetical protein ACIGXM_22330 [Kitasatospora sp. NPDC052896]|uniref:hypothetical protein n=1 Tax=Kitasatospora sp. NPDC052896 TaxID=3364061 RepID=UPI0037CB8337